MSSQETNSQSNLAPSDQLRIRTSNLHRAVERRVDWKFFLSSRESYASLLSRLAIIESAIQSSLLTSLESSPEWLRSRRSYGELENDLAAIGHPCQNDQKGSWNRKCNWINSEASAAGAIYVLEGSTLGGQYLAKVVERNLGLSAGSGSSYFNGYGEETIPRWRGTKDWLNSSLQNEADVSVAVKSARRTFAFYASVVCNPR